MPCYTREPNSNSFDKQMQRNKNPCIKRQKQSDVAVAVSLLLSKVFALLYVNNRRQFSSCFFPRATINMLFIIIILHIRIGVQ